VHDLLLVVEFDVLVMPVHRKLGAWGLRGQDNWGRGRTVAGWERVSHGHGVGVGPWRRHLLLSSSKLWRFHSLHVTRVEATHHGLGGDRPDRLLGRKVSRSILPPLQLCQTCSGVVVAILVVWTVSTIENNYN